MTVIVKNSLGGGVIWNKRLNWRVYRLTNTPSQHSHWKILCHCPLATNHHTQPCYLLPSASKIDSISTWQSSIRRLIWLKATFFLSPPPPSYISSLSNCTNIYNSMKKQGAQGQGQDAEGEQKRLVWRSAGIHLLKFWSSWILRRKVRMTVSRSLKVVINLESYKDKLLLEFGKC